MQAEIEFYREGGQWKALITTDNWLINDILEQCDRQQRVVVTIQPPEYPGYSMYRGGKHPRVLGTVLFEEIGVAPKDDE